jgi:hypothetical protein
MGDGARGFWRAVGGLLLSDAGELLFCTCCRATAAGRVTYSTPLAVTAQEIRICYRSAPCFAGDSNSSPGLQSWCKAKYVELMPCGSPSPTYSMSLAMQFVTLIFGTHRAHHNIQEHGVRIFVRICNLSVVRQWQLGVLGTLREQKRVATSSAQERVAVVCSKTYQYEDAHALQNQIRSFFWRGCRPEAEQMRTGHPARRGWCESAHRDYATATQTNTDGYLLLGALHMSWHGSTARHRSLW